MKKILSLLLLSIIFFFATFFSSQTPHPNVLSSQKKQITSRKQHPQISQQQPFVPSVIQSPLYPVVKVVDGDTIAVQIDGKKQTIRLIGINTPETVDPRRPVQCFGKQASDHAKALLMGKQVSLVADPTQSNRDTYGRLLRYVFLPDGTHINQQQIADGYAFEYTYKNNPYQYQSAFQQAEATAREKNKGLWAKNTCNGEHKNQN